MEALTSTLSTKIFIRNSNKVLSPSLALAPLGRFDIGSLRSPTFKRLLSHHHLVSSRTIANSHLASDAAEVCLENEAAIGPNLRTSRTIHLKFQLLKQCMFGDQLLLVGDAPMLGSWNPADAIPMNWSDGHVWSVELDVPIDLTIQFKIILNRSSGEIIWQPGPDRVFKSWQSNNTIIISEDWEDFEAQKILEEQVVNEFSSRESSKFPSDKQQEPAKKSNLSPVVGKNPIAVELEDEETLLLSCEEGNVLVPGAAPTHIVSSEVLTDQLGTMGSFGVDLA